MISPYIFREYDIRGLVEEDFTDENVLLLGKGIGTFLKNNGSKAIVVGRDDRLSSIGIRNRLVEGLLSTGLDVTDVGRVPTPTLYFAVMHIPADGAVMITGSHNPPEFNGLKIAGKGLYPVYGKYVQEIRDIIEGGNFEIGFGKVSEISILPEYLVALQSRLKYKKKLKIVVDAANGMASLVAERLWKSFGFDVVCIHCDSDGTFPSHTPDTILPEFYEDLSKEVLRVGADIGIGYDGDSDRFGAVDENGQIIDMDRILVLLIRDVLEQFPNEKVIFDVRCSQVLPEEVKKAGGISTLWKVGNSPIKAKMREIDAVFAGELVGHIMYREFFNIDDGLYASGRLLQILSNTDKTLSELDETIPRYISSQEIHLDVPDEIKFKLIAKLVKVFKKDYDVIDIDGARVEFGDGWGLVRASNTQPQIKLRFEARTKKRLMEIIEIFKTKLGVYSEITFSENDFSVLE